MSEEKCTKFTNNSYNNSIDNYDEITDSKIIFIIETSSQFSIDCINIQNKENIIVNSELKIILDSELNINHTQESFKYTRDYSELIKINEILEREINLLKSLILINNLNLNNCEKDNKDSKPCN